MVEPQIGLCSSEPLAEPRAKDAAGHSKSLACTSAPSLAPSLGCGTQRQNEGLLLGQLCGWSGDHPVVAFELGGTLYQATVFASVSSVQPEDIGARVCLALADGDLSRPILLGKIRNVAVADKLEITHAHEIALRCGKSTVQLKSDGTIAIRGTNVASRATQTNRIRGGNVQIN